MKLLVLALLALSLSRSAAAAPVEMGYELICESKKLIFTLTIADSDMATGKALLTIYDRIGDTGRNQRSAMGVRANIIWQGKPASRYISGFNYSLGSNVEVDVREKRGGSCENRLVGGTRYRAKINSNQPMLEFNKGNIECESTRRYLGEASGGLTSM